MEYNDFLKLQNDIKNILVEYTHFLKKAADLDLKYTTEFKDEIVKDFKLRNENSMLVQATTMLNDKKSLDEVDKYIEKYKANYSILFNNLNAKINNFSLAISNPLAEDKEKELEDHFINVVKTASPLLSIDSDPSYFNAFNLLQMLYQQHNYETYFADYDLNKELFKEKDYQNVDFEKYVAYYMSLMQNITADINDKKTKYPFTKENVFEDEITIARERGDFRAVLSKVSEANKAIKADFKALYGENVELY